MKTNIYSQQKNRHQKHYLFFRFSAFHPGHANTLWSGNDGKILSAFSEILGPEQLFYSFGVLGRDNQTFTSLSSRRFFLS